MSVFSLFRRTLLGTSPAAPRLHQAVVEASRRDSFFLAGQVPDTLDGRFEVMALHAALLLRRLRGQDDKLAQEIFDAIFAQIDLNLREMGVGDLGVGKRVRAMAEGLYGRMAAYETALMTDDEALYKALANNLFGTLPETPSRQQTQPFIDYIHASVAHLDAQPLSEICQGNVSFPNVSFS